MGEVLVLPEARIREEVMIVPGTDGEKMSKSRGNLLRIFAPEKELKKEVMGIVTDSTPLEDPKKPETCTVYKLFSLIAPADAVATMAENYRRGGYGYGHAKKELLQVLLDGFAQERDLFMRLMDDRHELDAQLAKGAARARSVGQEVLRRVRTSLGYS
jgi:tryptophanyl-tRNA synthetase